MANIDVIDSFFKYRVGDSVNVKLDSFDEDDDSEFFQTKHKGIIVCRFLIQTKTYGEFSIEYGVNLINTDVYEEFSEREIESVV